MEKTTLIMRLKYVVLLLFLLFNQSLFASDHHRTEVFDEAVRSLQLRVNDDWRNPPIIRMNKGDVLAIDFDILTGELPSLYFIIDHCDANWKKSVLSSVEYMRGFNRVDIDDYATSYNTLVEYVHYRINLTNDKFQPLVSGNYVVNVFDYDQPEKSILRACFSVTEDLLGIEASVTGITMKDYKKTNQQLKVKVVTGNLQVRNPQSELKLIVRQNGRSDNEQTITTPLYMGNNEIVYENNAKLVFSGGNQFRRFEMTTHKYSGMGIESISYQDPFYHVALHVDQVRSDKSYRYDQDQYGRYVVRALDVADSAIEADYYLTHFFLNMDDPLINGKIYLFGELSDFLIDDRFAMNYDATLRGYTYSYLLKEGYYNYMYLYVPNRSHQGQTSLVEGDFYETRNEYLIKVYYRMPGSRYDRLVATHVLYSYS